jgi:hypothetical protein
VAMPLSSCFGNSCAGPRAMTGRKAERYWRNYGDDPLPAASSACATMVVAAGLATSSC